MSVFNYSYSANSRVNRKARGNRQTSQTDAPANPQLAAWGNFGKNAVLHDQEMARERNEKFLADQVAKSATEEKFVVEDIWKPVVLKEARCTKRVVNKAITASLEVKDGKDTSTIMKEDASQPETPVEFAMTCTISEGLHESSAQDSSAMKVKLPANAQEQRESITTTASSNHLFVQGEAIIVELPATTLPKVTPTLAKATPVLSPMAAEFTPSKMMIDRIHDMLRKSPKAKPLPLASSAKDVNAVTTTILQSTEVVATVPEIATTTSPSASKDNTNDGMEPFIPPHLRRTESPDVSVVSNESEEKCPEMWELLACQSKVSHVGCRKCEDMWTTANELLQSLKPIDSQESKVQEQPEDMWMTADEINMKATIVQEGESQAQDNDNLSSEDESSEVETLTSSPNSENESLEADTTTHTKPIEVKESKSQAQDTGILSSKDESAELSVLPPPMILSREDVSAEANGVASVDRATTKVVVKLHERSSPSASCDGSKIHNTIELESEEYVELADTLAVPELALNSETSAGQHSHTPSVPLPITLPLESELSAVVVEEQITAPSIPVATDKIWEAQDEAVIKAAKLAKYSLSRFKPASSTKDEPANSPAEQIKSTSVAINTNTAQTNIWGKPLSKAILRDGTAIGGSSSVMGDESKGHAMMAKMGWTPGTALGSNATGMLEPVVGIIKFTKGGLGAKPAAIAQQAKIAKTEVEDWATVSAKSSDGSCGSWDGCEGVKSSPEDLSQWDTPSAAQMWKAKRIQAEDNKKLRRLRYELKQAEKKAAGIVDSDEGVLKWRGPPGSKWYGSSSVRPDRNTTPPPGVRVTSNGTHVPIRVRQPVDTSDSQEL